MGGSPVGGKTHFFGSLTAKWKESGETGCNQSQTRQNVSEGPLRGGGGLHPEASEGKRSAVALVPWSETSSVRDQHKYFDLFDFISWQAVVAFSYCCQITNSHTFMTLWGLSLMKHVSPTLGHLGKSGEREVCPFLLRLLPPRRDPG